MSSKLIGKCKNCDQYYCMDCSDALDETEYCSKACETNITVGSWDE